jgi:hypothetical protein
MCADPTRYCTLGRDDLDAIAIVLTAMAPLARLAERTDCVRSDSRGLPRMAFWQAIFKPGI